MNCPRTGQPWGRVKQPCSYSCQYPDGRRFCEFCLGTQTMPPFRGGQGDTDEEIQSEGSAVLFAFVLSMIIGLLAWALVFFLLSSY